MLIPGKNFTCTPSTRCAVEPRPQSTENRSAPRTSPGGAVLKTPPSPTVQLPGPLPKLLHTPNHSQNHACEPISQSTLQPCEKCGLGRFLAAVDLTQMQHGALHDAPLGAYTMVLHYAVIAMDLAVLLANFCPQKHPWLKARKKIYSLHRHLVGTTTQCRLFTSPR